MKPIVGVILALTCIILGTTQFLIERQIHKFNADNQQIWTTTDVDTNGEGGGWCQDNICQPSFGVTTTTAQGLLDTINANQKDLQGKIDALADQLNLEYVPDQNTDAPAHYKKKDPNSHIIKWGYISNVVDR